MTGDRFPDRSGATARVVNWNVDWAAPVSKKRPVILNRIYRDHEPDVVCLTEADVRLLSDSGGHVVTSQPDGVKAKEETTLRKVVLWSREPWVRVDDRGHDTLPPGKFVAATTRTPIGEVTVMGVCIPWHGSRTKWTNDGIVRRAWQDHLSYIGVLGQILERAAAERLVLVGDFNQQVGQYSSAPRKYTEALSAALPERMLIATAALGFHGRRVIDQIAVSADMAAEALTLISKYHANRLLPTRSTRSTRRSQARSLFDVMPSMVPMVTMNQEIRERIYAGVLGKLIGVYLGRAVEGWSYPAIRERFGEIANFVHHEVGMPLIVPDDDLSGTFVFFRALEDHGYDPSLSPRQIGETWLNYIIEDKTILWWGGMSRSTEHTAWLRLRQGRAAPASGSIALNGRAMAEQIGAQIFADGWALANPGAPERAARLARAAASVSHDGIAVDCAEFLAVLEALAFEEADAGRLLEQGLGFVGNATLRGLVAAVRERCAAAGDWREVRDWIEREHGYHRYPGNCPMVTNHLSVLMALLTGGGEFQRSLTIAASAGWDTDCNAGNVGCLNGVRLGLAALSAGVDLRAPVADRLYAVSADGGECVTDAVLETRRILRAAAALRGEEQPARQPRFGFEFPGSVQGFQVDREPHHLQAVTGLHNTGDGLQISYRRLAPGRFGRLRVQTCFAPEPSGVRDTSYFEVLASPTLYGTQTVAALVECGAGPQPSWRFFVRHYTGDGSLDTRYGEPVALQPGANRLRWQVPDCGGLPIYELGIELNAAQRLDGTVTLRHLDWRGAPERLEMGRADELSPGLTPWTTNAPWLKAFLSSARNLAPDYTTTFSISHPDDNGVLTIGTRDWDDYTVSSELTLVHQRTAGLVARARGHRRYYAAVLGAGEARLLKRRDGTVEVLARCPCDAPHDEPLGVALTVAGDGLRFALGGRALLAARDGEYAGGGAGFLVEEGGYLARGFLVERVASNGGDRP